MRSPDTRIARKTSCGAREYGLTLIGFLRGHRFVVYAGEERIGLLRTVAASDVDGPVIA